MNSILLSTEAGKNENKTVEIMLILDLADDNSVILTAPIDEVRDSKGGVTFLVGRLKSRSLIRKNS